MGTIVVGALAGLLGGAYAFWYLFFSKRRGIRAVALGLLCMIVLPLALLQAYARASHLQDPAAVRVLLRAWIYPQAGLVVVFLIFYRNLKQRFKG
jgi:hypothetical protein